MSARLHADTILDPSVAVVTGPVRHVPSAAATAARTMTTVATTALSHKRIKAAITLKTATTG